MTDVQHYGYNFRCRQPCIVYSASAQLPTTLVPGEVEAWLRDVILIPEENLPPKDEPDGAAQNARERRLLLLTVALHNELLQRAGVPVFDPGKILSIERTTNAETGDAFRFALALPAIDAIPEEVFTSGFANSLRLVTTHFVGKPDFDRISPLLDQLHEKVIKPMQARFVRMGYDAVPSGLLTWSQDIPARYLGNGVKRLGWGANARLMQYSSMQGDSAIGSGICRNKHRTAQFLREMGIPTAGQALVTSPEAAKAAAQRLGWPLVVKPAVGERSSGVTIDITDEATLASAFAEASKFHASVLVEQRIPGVCHRIAICNGELLYARSHRAKGVVGDGKRTVRELAEAETRKLGQQPPWRKRKPFVVDEIAVRCLAYDGLSADSVPAEGQFARLRPIMRSDWGATMDDFSKTIHPANVEICKAAARALGLAIAGIDMISEDITRPWHENGAIINEVNYMPQALRDLKRELRPKVAAALVPGDGRIPVHLVLAPNETMAHARKIRDELSGPGTRFHLTGAQATEGPEGEEIVLAGAQGLFDRTLALTARPDVHGLVLAASPGELDKRGFAIDRIDTVHVVTASDQQARAAWQQIDASLRTGGYSRLDP